MSARLKDWKRVADGLWSAAVFHHRDAALLALDVTRRGNDPALVQAAAQALPSLRAACLAGVDRRNQEIAQRRFGAMRDVLHALAGPQFGKRQAGRMLSPEEYHRQTLGLPLGRRLFGPEINQAFKRAAKRAHPDAGGDQRAFLELSAARDALMKSL